MEKINLIEQYGLLLDKNELKEKVETFGYHSISGHIFFVDILEYNDTFIKDDIYIPTIKDESSFKAFLYEAKEFCNKHKNQTYADFLSQKKANNLRQATKEMEKTFNKSLQK